MRSFVSSFLAISPCYLNLLVFCKLSSTLDDVNLVFLHQELNALTHTDSNITASFDNSREVSISLTLYCNTVIGCMVQIFEDLCTLKKSLRRDTSPVQTHTSQFGFLNDSSLKTQLGSSDGGYISSGTTPDYYQVIFFHYYCILC